MVAAAVDAARSRYPHLTSPVRLGPMALTHRIMMSGHGMGLADGGIGVSDRYRAYLEARARGGAALIGMESAPVYPGPENRTLRIQLWRDEVVASLAAAAEAVHAHGTRLSVILWHGGHKDSYLRGGHALSPSAIPNLAGEIPRVITRREIRDVVAAYGAATRRCRAAGLDAVEVQTATNYLLGSFLSPVLNHRSDEYGGRFENRLRIVREVLEAVREAAGDALAVGVRTSVSHEIPGAPEDYDAEESLAAMRTLAAEGLVDWVHLMTGSSWSAGSSIPAQHHPRPQLAGEAARFRREIAAPVIVAGRVRTPDEAERLLADGAADVVAMARSFIADPDWYAKAARGEAERIRPCLSCNQGCVGMVWRGIPGTCVINPAAGREQEIAEPVIAAAPGTVAVVGAGPAGLETARVAALRGHRVVVHEASEAIGGQWRLAADAPMRHELRLAIDWWRDELARLGVELRLGSRIDPASPPAADRVVWAIGARPAQTAVWRLRPWLRDGIPGSAGLRHGRDVLAGGAMPSGRVLVVDEEGGWPAVSLAETLAAASGIDTVTVATTESRLGAQALAITFEFGAVQARLAAAGVEVLPETTVARIDGPWAELPDGRRIGPYDEILLSTGVAAAEPPEDALAVGDCVAPRGLWAAVNEAARLAREL